MGTGRAESPLVLRERGRGRAAVVLAAGWWRWALRPGPAKEAYGRVWSSVAGWLSAGGPLPSQRVRPTSRVVPPGEAVEWTSSGVAPLHLTVFAVPGDSVVTDTALAQPVEALRTSALVTGELPLPGRLRFGQHRRTLRRARDLCRAPSPPHGRP